MNELENKLQRIDEFLLKKGLDALLLRRASSFAWATCGAQSQVNIATDLGTASLWITAHERLILTNNIEAARFEQEEALALQGWEIKAEPWPDALHGQSLQHLSGSKLRIGSDYPVSSTLDIASDISQLRRILTPWEKDRYRALGASCAAAMEQTMQSINPGQTEREIAGRLALECLSRGIEPIVNLVAADDRVYRFRHPLPTSKTVETYAMVVLCGRKNGLVCSLTRLVHFGRLPDQLSRKAEAIAQIDEAMLHATQPGNTLGGVFREAQSLYAHLGFEAEWQLHHQGGMAGYEPREAVATPDSDAPVTLDTAYAWNPSITGVKSEDTILLEHSGFSILTQIPGWPKVGHTSRPAILVQE